jgi:cold shock CspA family protein
VTDVAAARTGTVATYDDAAGYGSVAEADGAEWWFHCTAIADGSRAIPVGAAVRFRIAPGHLGRHEAVDLRPI